MSSFGNSGSNDAFGNSGSDDAFGTYDFGTWDIENDNESNQALHYQQQIEEKKKNILDSSKRSLGVVYESEDIGNETAHELVRQGEQLRRTEEKVDKVNRDLATSQRHITSIKSMFGGIKNYFSRKEEPTEPIPEARNNKLRTYLDSPSNKEEEEEREKRKMMNHPGMRNLPEYGETKQQSSMEQFDSQLDDNLDELSSGLTRLKGLAWGLGEELADQNEDIDRLTGKTTKVDAKIEKTNVDVKRLLRR